ncbi:WRKY transcription factor 22-like [Zingiber officinale]|uniref:WRKY domain-containing protein n=1 Tax=Zingiber officinale TaxID=94328 RepID=A0A8J5LGK4_ZINOF|nr:WRKY transcription factor 22-like [Zingiber officinale]KAG6518192.1 hypothetical protein ZIOFF_021595 [Zingiber officinale]
MWSSSPWVVAEEEWDLGAVVRGRRPPSMPRNETAWLPYPTTLDDAAAEEAVVEAGKGGFLSGFPDLLQRWDGFQELEELYKPFFFPKIQQQPLRRLGSPSASWVSPADASTAVVEFPQPQNCHRPPPQIPRSRRRKNQLKKVVCHVPADGLSADVWAWRKYGQKPIKGSPYPRGYYRCSSSKCCLARKQVERSRVDPAMFIITYTAEHNHPVPTHRNSLAGSSRHKFPSPVPASAAADNGAQPPSANNSSNPPSVGLSPTTPLTASMEEEILRLRSEDGDVGDEAEDDEEEDEMLLDVEGMHVMGEDDLLFLGGAASPEAETLLDDGSASADHRFPLPWMPHSSNAPAAASSI